MPDLEIVDAFQEVVKPNIVQIVTRRASSGECGTYGSGCIFGRVGNPAHGNMAFILTAAHIVRLAEDEEGEVDVVREQLEGEPFRRAVFNYRAGTGGGPRVFWHKEDPANDLAAVIVPSKCYDGADFLRPEEVADGCCPGIRMIEQRLMVGEGTRVAWAGYPEVANRVFSDWRLCYSEGPVAYCENDAVRPGYLLDGHNDHGVSGGPVWWWNDKKSQAELFAIVSGYRHTRDEGKEMPGVVWAAAIQPFLALFERHWAKVTRKGSGAEVGDSESR